jgi:hypothetical protein
MLLESMLSFLAVETLVQIAWDPLFDKALQVLLNLRSCLVQVMSDHLGSHGRHTQ